MTYPAAGAGTPFSSAQSSSSGTAQLNLLTVRVLHMALIGGNHCNMLCDSNRSHLHALQDSSSS